MRLPFAPLTEALGSVWYEQQVKDSWGKRLDCSVWRLAEGSHAGTISELTGYNRKRLDRWRREGIPLEDADRIAVALGLHPASIWERWYEVSA